MSFFVRCSVVANIGHNYFDFEMSKKSKNIHLNFTNVSVCVGCTAVGRLYSAVFPPELSENDGAFPSETLLHHCDLITTHTLPHISRYSYM